MNLKQLEYFVSVAETLNFTKAAKKCFISQTAMTQQIRALEEGIGAALFIRDKHHVELTPAGRVFMNEARVILARAEEAVKLAPIGGGGNFRLHFHRLYQRIRTKSVFRNAPEFP